MTSQEEVTLRAGLSKIKNLGQACIDKIINFLKSNPSLTANAVNACNEGTRAFIQFLVNANLIIQVPVPTPMGTRQEYRCKI